MLPKPPKKFLSIFGLDYLVSIISVYKLRKKKPETLGIEDKGTQTLEQTAKIATIKSDIQSRKAAIANKQVKAYIEEELILFRLLRLVAKKRSIMSTGHTITDAGPKISFGYPLGTFVGKHVFAYEAKNSKKETNPAFYYIDTTGLMTSTTEISTNTEEKDFKSADYSGYRTDTASTGTDFKNDIGEKDFKPIDYKNVKVGPDDILIILISDRNPIFTPETLLRVVEWAYKNYNYVLIIPTGYLQRFSITLDRVIEELDEEQKDRIAAVLSGGKIEEKKPEESTKKRLQKDDDKAIRKEQQTVRRSLEIAEKSGFKVYCEAPDKLLSQRNLKKLATVNSVFDKLVTALLQDGLSDEAARVSITRKTFTLDKNLREKVSSLTTRAHIDNLEMLIKLYTSAFLNGCTTRQTAKAPPHRYHANVLSPSYSNGNFSELLTSPEPANKVALIVSWQAIRNHQDYISRSKLGSTTVPSTQPHGFYLADTPVPSTALSELSMFHHDKLIPHRTLTPEHREIIGSVVKQLICL